MSLIGFMEEYLAVIEKREREQNGKIITRFKATVTIKGFSRTSKTFDRKTDAQEWAQKTEYEYKHQRSFGQGQHKNKTVVDVIKRYSDSLKLTNPKRYNGVEPILEWWKTRVGKTKLTELSSDLIIQQRDRLKNSHVRNNSQLKKVSNARVNRYMAALSRVLNIASDEWGWLVKNPMSGIEKLPEPSGRTRFLQADELNRLMEAAKCSGNEDMTAIIALAVTTGARRGEIENIRFKDVDLNQRKILLPVTKNKKPRILYLVEPAYSLIKDICNHPRSEEREYMFASPHDSTRANSFRRAWNTAVKRAKLTDFKFHDLRHTAASYLAQHGAGLHQISEVLGHSSFQVTQRYVHLIEKNTAAIVETTAAKVFGYDKHP